jgi:hypothetical protein
MDKFLFITIADWLINLSGSWFAVAIIVPPLAKKPPKLSLILLTGNLILGILSLSLAAQIKRSLGVL